MQGQCEMKYIVLLYLFLVSSCCKCDRSSQENKQIVQENQKSHVNLYLFENNRCVYWISSKGNDTLRFNSYMKINYPNLILIKIDKSVDKLLNEILFGYEVKIGKRAVDECPDEVWF